MTPEYILLRSRRRTMSLSVDREGRAVLRAPLSMPKSKADEFVAKHTDWLQRQRERLAALPAPPTKTELAALKAKTEARMTPILKNYSALTGLEPTGVKYTCARSRYGSCSAKNSLCFSYMLADMDEKCLEAVALHELAHIKHKNHGPRFYALIYKYMPDYPQRKALLKNGGKEKNAV